MSFTKKKKRLNNIETPAATITASHENNDDNAKGGLTSNIQTNDNRGSSGSNINGCIRNGGGNNNNNKELTAMENGVVSGNNHVSIESDEIISRGEQSNSIFDGKQQVVHVNLTKDSHLPPKRRFVVLARLFKPWKWKRKKKADKNNSKGILSYKLITIRS